MKKIYNFFAGFFMILLSIILVGILGILIYGFVTAYIEESKNKEIENDKKKEEQVLEEKNNQEENQDIDIVTEQNNKSNNYQNNNVTNNSSTPNNQSLTSAQNEVKEDVKKASMSSQEVKHLFSNNMKYVDYDKLLGNMISKYYVIENKRYNISEKQAIDILQTNDGWIVVEMSYTTFRIGSVKSFGTKEQALAHYKIK